LALVLAVMGTLHSPFRPFLLIVVLSVVFVFIISTGMLFSTTSSLVLKYMLITYRQANCFNVKGRTVKEFTNGNKKKKDYDSGMAPVIAVSEDTLFNKTGARVTGQKKRLRGPRTVEA